MASRIDRFPSPARKRRIRRRLPGALAAALACAAVPTARAQAADATVVVTGRGVNANAGIAGFGDTPLSRAPLQAVVFGNAQLADSGITSIGGLTRLDASVGDAYNAEGYWSIVSARGYTLDNRFNYRRDGLPINAETAIALDNKASLELLKGTSGIQAGTSAPGGLVNLVVKRPDGRIREARFEFRQAGSVAAAVDIGDRVGVDGRLSWRLNAAAEHLDPVVRDTRGNRHLLALAGDWQLSPGTLVQAEIERSHQSQPSVAGYSLLGNSVPDAKATDPRRNLNAQPWRQPVVMDGSTASLRLQQRLTASWNFTAHAMQQTLKSDDRTAFPYGVYDPATYDCPLYCDRFAPDGSFTYWQYVSDGERRTSRALSLAVDGQTVAAGIAHRVEAGMLFTRYAGRFNDQVFDIAGTGNVDGSLLTPPSAGYPDANTNRAERSTEFFVRDAMRLAPAWQLWAGLRHTRLERASIRTSVDSSGSLRATDYSAQATLPWLALAHEISPATVLYASWGQGLESDVAPNRPRYSNAGAPLPALKSRQFEAGVKHAGDSVDLGLAFFDIDRPRSADIGTCSAPGSCLRAIDGSARHRGLEASAALRAGAFTWQASAMALRAERRGSTATPALNGSRPENVPERTLRLGGEYRVAALPGLALQASLAAESNRVVLPYDDSVRIPGWQRLDLGARWRQSLGSTTLTWRVAVDNITDQRAWKESPYQFGHAYLYPLMPRSWRASVQTMF